jgi:hypothetical protein
MTDLEKLIKENEKLIEACGKAAGTIDFLVAVLNECVSKEGSEIAKAALQSLV